MYIEFAAPQRMSFIKKVLGDTIHCETAKGSPEDASEYCMKDGDYVEFGELGKGGQGRRNDIASLRDAIKAGKSDLDIVESSLVIPWVKYRRGVVDLRGIYDAPSERDEIKVALFYGPPGTKITTTRISLTLDANSYL